MTMMAAMAEFVLFMPVPILLLFGMTFTASYALRSASTDWGVFITRIALQSMAGGVPVYAVRTFVA